MNYEIKSAQTASVREIYYDKNLNKMVFKNDLGIITPLESTNTSNTILGTSIWANGFRIVGCIGEDIVLPDNSTIEFTGPLSMCSGATLTVPAGTTLTIV